MSTCEVRGWTKCAGIVAVGLVAAACSKGDSGGAPSAAATAVPREAPTIAITGTPVASPSATSSASPSASVVEPSAPPSASPKASASSTTSAKASASGALEDAPSKNAPKDSTDARDVKNAGSTLVALKPAAARTSGKNFTLEAASPGCRVDAPCTMTLRLVASGDYHVNKEYPYKFIAAPAPGIHFQGNGDANTFSRAAGDFREESEKAAVLTIRFKPTSAGEAKVVGTYKMSVCSAENCQIETQPVSLSIPVM